MRYTSSPQKISLCILLLLNYLSTVSCAIGTLQISLSQSQINNSPVIYTFSLSGGTLTSPSFVDVPANSIIYIDFPSDYTGILPGSPVCQDANGNTLSCSLSSRRVTIPYFFTLGTYDTSFTFKVTGLKNPAHTGDTTAIAASIVSPAPASSTLVEGSKTVTISEGTATCSLSTVSKVVGGTTTVTFSFTPTTPIPLNGGLEITLPWWSPLSESMVVNSGSVVCTITSTIPSTSPGNCYVQTVSSGTQIMALMIPNAVPSGTALTLQFQSIRNPPVQTAYSIKIRSLDSSNSALDACTTSLKASVPNSIIVDSSNFLTCTSNSNTKKINLQEVCLLSFTTTNPLPMGSTINVRFPSEVGVSSTYRVGEDIPYSNASLTIASSPTFPDILLTNPVISYTSGSQRFILRFTSIRHPSTTKPTSSFQITTAYGGDEIDKITDGASYTASAGDLSNVIFTASPSQAGSLSDVTVSFSVGNGISSSSQIKITFPSEFTTGPATVYCSASGTNKMAVSPGCSMTSNVLTISSYATDSITSSDTVRIVIHNLILPKTTKPTTTTVQISTLDGGYVVDKSSSVYFQSTVATISSGLSLTVSNGAEVAGLSDYTVAFQNKNPIPATGVFQIGLPVDNTVTISSQQQLNVETNTKLQVDGGTLNNLVTTVSTISSIVTLSFSNPTGLEIAAGTSIKVVIPSLTNPSSTALTNSFSVRTLTSDSYPIDATTTGLNVLANMISPSDFQTVSIAPSPTTTGAQSAYKFTVVPKAAHTSAHTLSLTFPSSITFKSSVTCLVNKPVAQTAQSCPPDANNVITIPLGQAVAALATFELVVSGVANPTIATTYSGFTLATMISTAKVHQTVSALSVTIKPSEITGGTLTRSSKVPNTAAVFTFNFVPINQYPSDAYLEVIVPSQLSVSTASTLACTDLLGFGSTPTCVVKAGTTRTILITGGGAYSSTRIRFSLASIVNQASQIDSDSFIISIKDTTSNHVIDQITSGLVSLSPCDPSCLTCKDDDRLACTSCDTTINKLFDVVNFKCVDNCAVGTYKDGLQCKGCSNRCKECTGPASNECSSCNTNSAYPYFYLRECRSVCPDKFYPDASSACLACDSPCETCSSSSVCKTCDSTTYFYSGTCKTYCPSGYYKNTNPRECTKCKSTCLTCDAMATCTSCDLTSTYKIFHNDQCLDKCPDGFFSSGNTCEACETPCTTCSLNKNYCLSCKSGLFAEAGECKTCSPTCETCSGGIDLCSSCAFGFLLQGSKCVSSCSEGYYADTALNQCVSCPSGCQACSSRSKCTSCDVTSSTPFLYDGACVSSCPSDASTVSNRQCVATISVERINPYDGLYRNGLPFPFLIFALAFGILSFVGKITTDQTFVVTNMLGFLAPLELGSWIALGVLLFLSHPDDSIADFTGFPIVAFGLIASIVINIVFYFKVIRPLVKDQVFVSWKNKRRLNRVSSITAQVFAILTFKSFRLVYSRFFNLEPMSAPISDTAAYLSTFNKYLGLNFFLSVLPAFIAAVITIHKDSIFAQLLNISIEIIIISLVTIALSIYEALRANEFEKKSIVPDQSNLIDSPSKMLEESVLNKLNSGEASAQMGFRRVAGSNRERNSNIIEASYEFNDADSQLNQSSSFINLNNTMTEKRAEGRNDESFDAEFGEVANGKEENSKIDAIEEIEKEDDDEEPTLNMNSKTMGKLQEVLKGKGHELQPQKILIENKDGSIVVVKDTGISPKKGKRKVKDGENGTKTGNEQDEESEQELELHDSFDEKQIKDKDDTIDTKDNSGQNHQANENGDMKNSRELKVSTEGLLEKGKRSSEEEDFEIVNSGVTKREEFSSPVEVVDSPELKAVSPGKDGKGNSKEGSPQKENDGFEYVSSDSQVTADDMNDHFMDDTPSNYNVLNQRYDEEFISPAVLVQKQKGPEVDLMRKSLSGSPPKPVIMQHNFVDNKQDPVGHPDYRSTMKDFPPRPNTNTDKQGQQARSSYGKPMLGEKSKIMAEAGMRSITPQYSQEQKRVPDIPKGQGQGQGRRSGTPTGPGYKVSGSLERKRGDSTGKTGRLSEKTSVDRINELEGMYMKKKDAPSMKSSLSKNSNSKKQGSHKRSGDDDLTDNEELELDNFGKFEEFVNGMKKQNSVQKFEADSFDRENI